MKRTSLPRQPVSGIAVSLLRFLVVSMGMIVPCALHATVIDLSRPVSESLTSISGIYWSANSLTPAAPPDSTYATTPDSSGNSYTGLLIEGNGAPHTLVPGVNRAGTSGYGNALRLATSATTPGTLGNPKILINLPITNQLAMVDTSFTGGAWLNFNSLLPGPQTISVIERGIWGSAGGNWGLRLQKSSTNSWDMLFQTGDGTTRETVSITLPNTLALSTSEWHHFGFSYAYGEGEATNAVTFWVDGVSYGTANIAVNISADATSGSRRFIVGERGTTGYQSVFDGSVDDIFVTTGLHQFQAIPEPGTYAMILLGTGILWGIRRRNRA